MMLVDYFRVFSWISGKKGQNKKNLGNYRVLRRGVGIPTQQRRFTPRHGMSTLRRSEATLQ